MRKKFASSFRRYKTLRLRGNSQMKKVWKKKKTAVHQKQLSRGRLYQEHVLNKPHQFTFHPSHRNTQA